MPVLVNRGPEGLPLYCEVAHPGRLTAPLLRGQVRVLAFSVTDRGWLGRAQRLDLVVRIAPTARRAFVYGVFSGRGLSAMAAAAK